MSTKEKYLYDRREWAVAFLIIAHIVAGVIVYGIFESFGLDFFIGFIFMSFILIADMKSLRISVAESGVKLRKGFLSYNHRTFN